MSRKVRIVLITMLTIAVCSFLGFTYVNTFVNGQTEHPDLALDSLNDPLLQGQNGHVPDHTYSNEASLNPPNYESTNSGYDLVILINSEMSYFESRKQIRKELFGVVDNLKPCLGYNGRINYKFFVSESDMNIEDLRRLRSEIMEYDDIVTLPKISTWKKEYSMLHWVHSKQTSMEYRHVMLLDSFTYVRVDQILSELDYMTQEATENQQELPILWGNLELERNQTRAIVLGESLVEDLLTIPSLLPLPGAKASIMSRILDNRDNDLVSHIPMISDNRFVEWPNNPHILPKNAIAVTMVYQPEELALITARLQPNQPPLCIDPRPETKIGIITSSFIYKDGCMMDAGLLSATNKRNYAAKHGYYFIARSMEFAQQIYRGRRIVWGKIDAVEKALPEYDWLLWLDMDAVIMNEDIRVEDILEEFRRDLGDDLFSKKSLFVTKPKRDPMINAGVFLLKNSQWSLDYLREVQHRQENYNTVLYEQRAMWNVAREPKWAEGAHIFGDTSVFNTFPNSYVPGNFVVHFAPAGCPAEEVTQALKKNKHR